MPSTTASAAQAVSSTPAVSECADHARRHTLYEAEDSLAQEPAAQSARHPGPAAADARRAGRCPGAALDAAVCPGGGARSPGPQPGLRQPAAEWPQPHTSTAGCGPDATGGQPSTADVAAAGRRGPPGATSARASG